MVMWKSQSDRESLNPPAQPAAPQPVTPPTPAAAPATPPAARNEATATHISKTVVLKGSVSGNENLFIDGRIEGTIELPASVVTIGVNGQVEAAVTARELIILGKLKGNVVSAERVEIRAQGSLIGDVSAIRISIEDGAFFKGSIDIRKEGKESKGSAKGAVTGS